MARSRGTFRAGSSGNPSGRPPKHRALTDILEKAGRDQHQNVEGDLVQGRNLVARMLWDIAATGEALLPNGETLRYGARDWFEVVKFLYIQIDGPVKPIPPPENDEGKAAKSKVPDFEDLKDADANELLRAYREACGET